MSARPPPRLGRFELLTRLGGGAQGTVFLANDPNLGRRVAIKVLHGDIGGAKSNFPQEARASGRLQHPNIVSIYDAGEYHGVPYLVFEYVRGHTLRALLDRQGSFSVTRACCLMEPIINGLAYAHEQGVVHLDLSPGNILVDEFYVPRIMDFGLARVAGAALGAGEYPEGTLRYMSPEHFREMPLGPHTDVFALSLIFYELVTGKPANSGKTVSSVVTRLMHEPIDMSPFAESELKQKLAQFLREGLEKDSRERFADGPAMKVAFRGFLDTLESNERLEGSEEDTHSTLEFLLRRMKRKKDFPVLSQALADINRLASSTSNASVKKLANVILRDYALTNKLLKVANSAFYGNLGGEVTSISHAVRILGFEQVRLAANSLTYFSHLNSDTATTELKDSLTQAFVSGLLTRYLAQRAKLPGVEEAFICGMFQNLGETLTIYYFPEEHREINELIEGRSLGKSAASTAVLGISYSTLATGVARAWKFPEEIIYVIRGVDDGPVAHPDSARDRLRDFSVFANALCDIVGSPRHDDEARRNEGLTTLAERFERSFRIPAGALPPMLRSAMEKLGRYSSALGMNTVESPFCQAINEWVGLPAENPDGRSEDLEVPARRTG